MNSVKKSTVLNSLVNSLVQCLLISFTIEKVSGKKTGVDEQEQVSNSIVIAKKSIEFVLYQVHFRLLFTAIRVQDEIRSESAEIVGMISTIPTHTFISRNISLHITSTKTRDV